MEDKKEETKNRTVSSTSTSSSVTEYVNEMFENSELEMSKAVSIEVTNDMQPMGSIASKMEKYKGAEKLKDFSEMPVSEVNSSEFIPQGFRKMYIAALVVLLFGVCMGITATYSATATSDMRKSHSPIRPSDDEISLIGSLMAIGALLGGTAGGYLTNALGRKGTLIINSVPFVGGWIIIAYAKSVGVIYIGRLITGFSTGLLSVATPMYLVEISTPEVRGLLGASFQLFVVIGVLIISGLGAGLRWEWLAISGATFTVMAAALMLLMPESPRWLVSKKRNKEAKKAMIFLQGQSFDAESECQRIEEEIKSQPSGGVSLMEFKVPTVYKPFILSILLMFFQQFSGVNAVLFYTVDIFKAAHVALDPVVCTIIVSVVQVLATLLSSILMDRAGRRPLLLISAVCMSISLLIFGGYDLAKRGNPKVTDQYGWLPIVCLTSFIAAFSIGFGPTPWLMVAEMTSVRFRSIVSGIATALNWTFVFIITFTFKKLETGIKGYGVYWLYAAFCLSSTLVTFFLLPETKGKDSKEIEDFFRRRKKSMS